MAAPLMSAAAIAAYQACYEATTAHKRAENASNTLDRVRELEADALQRTLGNKSLLKDMQKGGFGESAIYEDAARNLEDNTQEFVRDAARARRTCGESQARCAEAYRDAFSQK